MYVEIVPNRNSRPAVLLREGWREGSKVKKRTLANLTDWPAARIEALRRVLRNEPVGADEAAFVIERSLPHGHVAAVLGTARRCGVEKLLAGAPAALRPVVLALIVARVIEPGSKLCAAAASRQRFALAGARLGRDRLDSVYEALDWLAKPSRASSALRAAPANGCWCSTTQLGLGHGTLLSRAAFGKSRDDKGNILRSSSACCAARGLSGGGGGVCRQHGRSEHRGRATRQAQARFGLTPWLGGRSGHDHAGAHRGAAAPAGMSWIRPALPDIAN